MYSSLFFLFHYTVILVRDSQQSVTVLCTTDSLSRRSRANALGMHVLGFPAGLASHTWYVAVWPHDGSSSYQNSLHKRME